LEIAQLAAKHSALLYLAAAQPVCGWTLPLYEKALSFESSFQPSSDARMEPGSTFALYAIPQRLLSYISFKALADPLLQ